MYEVSTKARIIWAIIGIVLIVLGVGLLVYGSRTEQAAPDSPPVSDVEPDAPELSISTAAEGYSHIWDMVFINETTAVFSERAGRLYGLDIDTGEDWQIAELPMVQAGGEGGLLGLALDSSFADNRTMYACYNAAGPVRSVRVGRFVLQPDNRSIGEITEIITDIESQGGRHSGCRLHMDSEGVLWIGTGDSALGAAPQNPASLASKVLRVDRDGQAASGNLGAPFDPRIYSYGHRNVQGLVVLDQPLANGARGFTAEHGPDRDDEINWLRSGNFGWDPNGQDGRYDESVPMTDLDRYPDAHEPVWRSGSPTIAPSGIAILQHERWGLWQGRLVMATLKGQHVRLLDIAEDGSVRSQQELLTDFGRIRTVRMAPGGDLFITTDNSGGQDRIIRVSPR